MGRTGRRYLRSAIDATIEVDMRHRIRDLVMGELAKPEASISRWLPEFHRLVLRTERKSSNRGQCRLNMAYAELVSYYGDGDYVT